MININAQRLLIRSLLALVFIINTIACDTENENDFILEKGTVEDTEGNIYQTVKIGDQWWMAENLRSTNFRSGLAIERVDSNEDWRDSEGAAYCVYQDSPLAPGLLYNFLVLSSKENIAPVGWHVATDEDWKKMESFLGMAESELEEVNWRGEGIGDKLKIEATEGWSFYEGVWATNETGFSAQGGGSRFYDGNFGIPGLKDAGFWWTSSENDGEGWYRYLDYKKSGKFRYYGNPNYGFSIRCVKD